MNLSSWFRLWTLSIYITPIFFTSCRLYYYILGLILALFTLCWCVPFTHILHGVVRLDDGSVCGLARRAFTYNPFPTVLLALLPVAARVRGYYACSAFLPRFAFLTMLFYFSGGSASSSPAILPFWTSTFLSPALLSFACLLFPLAFIALLCAGCRLFLRQPAGADSGSANERRQTAASCWIYHRHNRAAPCRYITCPTTAAASIGLWANSQKTGELRAGGTWGSIPACAGSKEGGRVYLAAG